MSEIAFQSSATIKTVLEIDLVSYSDIARVLEENLDVEAVRKFEDQIQRFVDQGLSKLGLRRDNVVLGSAGDNAILIFDNAATMHRFADSVQQETWAYNAERSVDLAKRWFRMGAATGIVQFLPDRRVVGTTIARAVRLEAAAAKGQLIVDVDTFKALPEDMRELYGSEETIPGKREEQFRGYRCAFLDVEPPSHPSGAPARNAKAKAHADGGLEQIKIIYDLYRTSYLNQKYYGFRLRNSDKSKDNDNPSHIIRSYEVLFQGYAEVTSMLRAVVEEIRTRQGISRKIIADYRRMRETVVGLEKIDEPHPDRALIKRFEREVNREIPLRVLWFPEDN